MKWTNADSPCEFDYSRPPIEAVLLFPGALLILFDLPVSMTAQNHGYDNRNQGDNSSTKQKFIHVLIAFG